MAKNSTSSVDRAQQVGQAVRGTADVSPTKRTTAVDNALNGNNTARK